MAVQSVKELRVYKKAYQQAMSFFETSKRFPAATTLNHEVGKMLGAMIKCPDKFFLTPDP